MKIGIGVWVVIIAALAVLGYIGYSISNLQISSGGITTGGTTGGTQITTDVPEISVAANDAQQSGTTVNTVEASSKFSVDSESSFATVDWLVSQAPIGSTIRLFIVNGTSYHNEVWNKDGAIKTTAATFPVNVAMKKNATITETMYYQNSALSNGVGNTNVTDLGNGISYSFDDEMQANALTSTNDMICVIELSAGVNASTDTPGVTVDGKQSEAIDISSWYTIAGVDSKTYVFSYPAISTTAPYKSNILVTAKSNGRFQQGTYMKKMCYTKEWFIDPTTGKLTYAVADSQGTVKSLARYVFTAYFDSI